MLTRFDHHTAAALATEYGRRFRSEAHRASQVELAAGGQRHHSFVSRLAATLRLFLTTGTIRARREGALRPDAMPAAS